MTNVDLVTALTPEVVAWRHRIHATPELGFEERETARFVAEQLRSFGLEVHTGIGGTGVVGVLRVGERTRAIGLRAELDALPITERSGVPHASTRAGVMHACDHDGHTAMLLGAARILSRMEGLDGTVYFIFQPAEENLGGGSVMIGDGLFERFPMSAVYALHNWPGLPVGTIAVRSGPQMAAENSFTVTFAGLGSHAAMPHLGDDPVLAASGFVVAVQRVASRAVDPQVPLVVSITRIHGGHAGNVVPTEVVLHGTCRFFDPALSATCEWLLSDIAEGIANAHGVSFSLVYRHGSPPVIIPADQAAIVTRAAEAALGPERVMTAFTPSLGCEDFAWMQGKVPGCYAWLGAGEFAPGAGLHGDRYDFNDEMIPHGLRLWIELARQALAKDERSESAQGTHRST